jgi:hypothetical protein
LQGLIREDQLAAGRRLTCLEVVAIEILEGNSTRRPDRLEDPRLGQEGPRFPGTAQQFHTTYDQGGGGQHQQEGPEFTHECKCER